MKNIIVLTALLCSMGGFAQDKKNDIAVRKIVPIEVEVSKENPVKIIAPTLDLKSTIISGFKTGNAKLIARYFLANIDISLLEKENLYSKSQGEQVLNTFFTEHKPSDFSINHEGKSSNIKYYIGTLVTAKSKFRITINTKMVNGVELISHLTIETED